MTTEGGFEMWGYAVTYMQCRMQSLQSHLDTPALLRPAHRTGTLCDEASTRVEDLRFNVENDKKIIRYIGVRVESCKKLVLESAYLHPKLNGSRIRGGGAPCCWTRVLDAEKINNAQSVIIWPKIGYENPTINYLSIRKITYKKGQ